MQFRLRLSNPSVIMQINQRLADGRFTKVIVKLRSIELEILDASFLAFARNTNRLTEYLQIVKYLHILQNANDSVADIKLSKTDFENLIAGFEQTKGNRPDHWARCLEFFVQLDGPEQIEDEPEPEIVPAKE